MFKLTIVVIIALAIWGGVNGAFNVKNEQGSINVQVDKQKVLDSIQDGASKAKNVIENIDKLSTEKN